MEIFFYISLILILAGVISFAVKRDLFSKFLSLNLSFSGIFFLVITLSKTLGYFSLQHLLLLIFVASISYFTIGMSLLTQFKKRNNNLSVDDLDYEND
jgi:NADH:ubiquinone oxidoreductase subunit K